MLQLALWQRADRNLSVNWILPLGWQLLLGIMCYCTDINKNRGLCNYKGTPFLYHRFKLCFLLMLEIMGFYNHVSDTLKQVHESIIKPNFAFHSDLFAEVRIWVCLFLACLQALVLEPWLILHNHKCVWRIHATLFKIFIVLLLFYVTLHSKAPHVFCVPHIALSHTVHMCCGN